jgi:hypothetical protein
MQVATDEAIAEADSVPELLKRYLSEAPIGDEYEALTPAEWELGQAFATYLQARGIEAFEQPDHAPNRQP